MSKFKEPETQDQNVLYALHYQGKLLGTFKWASGKPDYLQGWRPPKKIYFKVGQANCGVSHLPKDVQKDIEIIEYRPASGGGVVQYDTIAASIRKKKREISRLRNHLAYEQSFSDNDDKKIKLLKYGTEEYYRAKADIASCQRSIDKLKNKIQKLELEISNLEIEQNPRATDKIIVKNDERQIIGAQG